MGGARDNDVVSADVGEESGCSRVGEGTSDVAVPWDGTVRSRG